MEVEEMELKKHFLVDHMLYKVVVDYGNLEHDENNYVFFLTSLNLNE
jgi:hypothetical protein